MTLKEKLKGLKAACWGLALVPDGIEGLRRCDIREISLGRYKKERWFADPFILDWNEQEVHVLVEDYPYSTRRGRISRITIDKKRMEVVNLKPLLDIDTHLSFPVIYRQHDGRIIITPENYQSGGFNAYEYIENGLRRIGRISTELFTDTIIRRYGDEYVLFSTKEPTSNGSVLGIYKAADFMGPYKLVQEVSFSENIARNGGDFCNYAGMIVRVAQECNDCYGHALSLQEVIFDSASGKFSFREIDRILSPSRRYNLGIHTYNEYRGLGVVDLHGWCIPAIGAPYDKLDRWLKSKGLKK